MATEDVNIIIEDVTVIESIDEEEEVLPSRYLISSYGADYIVSVIVDRLKKHKFIIPEFQREFVWNKARSSQFIESLIIGLPVPGIFLYRGEDSPVLMVIDGLQRLRTLQMFYEGTFSKGDSQTKFALVSVQKSLLGKTFDELDSDDKDRLDDAIIHATIIKQDEPEDGLSSLFNIFQRINTGGMNLYPQEIRKAIFHKGNFVDLLQELNETESWRTIFGSRHSRLKDQELILRFLSLYFGKPYSEPMLKFLNDFLSQNNKLDDESKILYKQIFAQTINIVCDSIGEDAFKPERALNAAVFDSVMVGIAKRLESGPITETQSLKKAYRNLLLSKDFENAYKTATTNTKNVSDRIALSIGAFAEVK